MSFFHINSINLFAIYYSCAFVAASVLLFIAKMH